MPTRKSREPRKNKKTKPSAIKRKEQRAIKNVSVSRRGNIK